MSLRVSIPCILVFALMFSPARGQTVSATTSPVGAVSLGAYTANTPSTYIGLQGNSDTFVSLPLTRPPVFVGTTSGVPTGSTIPISGSPDWTSNQFVYASGSQTNTYYVLIGANGATTNPKEGCLYTITGNGASDLTINLSGDMITSIPAGTQVTIIPFWTLGTVFPAANAGVSFTASSSSLSMETAIYIPDYYGNGINRAFTNIYYFNSGLSNANGTGWRQFGQDPTVPCDDIPLLPNSYFVVHNSNGAPTLPLVLTGSVLTGKVTTPLVTQIATAHDNMVAMMRPVAVTLDTCGLSPADGSFLSSSNSLNLTDILYTYNNATVSYNKSPAQIYYYSSGAWRLFGSDPTVDHGTDTISAGSPMLVEKAATVSGSSLMWTNAAQY